MDNSHVHRSNSCSFFVPYSSRVCLLDMHSLRISIRKKIPSIYTACRITFRSSSSSSKKQPRSRYPDLPLHCAAMRCSLVHARKKERKKTGKRISSSSSSNSRERANAIGGKHTSTIMEKGPVRFLKLSEPREQNHDIIAYFFFCICCLFIPCTKVYKMIDRES